eukprot:7126828-Pyramimonas_sp.AAC.1
MPLEESQAAQLSAPRRKQLLAANIIDRDEHGLRPSEHRALEEQPGLVALDLVLVLDARHV